MFSKTLIPVLLVMALIPVPGRAEAMIDERLYELGVKICTEIANGKMEVPGAQAYLERSEAAGEERAEFCDCVGHAFGLNPAQKARMEISEGDVAAQAMLEILLTNMNICTSGQLIYADLITSKDDAWQCRQVVDGDRALRGLDFQSVQAAMKEFSLDREEVCGCAAGFITSVEDLIDAKPIGMEMPSASYQMQMATGIRLCAHL